MNINAPLALSPTIQIFNRRPQTNTGCLYALPVAKYINEITGSLRLNVSLGQGKPENNTSHQKIIV